MAFADNLKTLPSIDHLSALALFDAAGDCLATIENKPGKAGSLAVYHALAQRHGGRIGPAAAEEGLLLFGEHTDSARAHPGSHPNIDRLFDVIDRGLELRVELQPKG